MPRVTCPKCKAADMVHSEGGTAVLDENPIVSEITWTEEPGGASSVVGQFISSTGTKVFRKGGPGGHAKESREVTIENGRKKIAQIAGGLKLKQHHIEAAQRLFMLAVQHNFIQGRKTQNVVAACLYIVCRREKTPHMLIDFSDILQTNVYVLGHTYLRFCKRLNLQLPIIDPSLYIPRFCGKLEFEEKAQMVANTALRLVQRMRRDWIQTGRRPSGICGAALLISARLHGFKRTQKEIIQVVRICDVTLRKRLQEFALTPSSNLTLPWPCLQCKLSDIFLNSHFKHEDFEVIEIEEECDPPAFTRARKEDAVKDARSPKDDEENEIAKEMAEALGSAEVRQVEANPGPLVQQAQQDTERDPSDFTDLNDDELDKYLHDDEEVKAKTAIWTEINKDYLAAQEEKEREEAANIAAGKPPQKKKKRRRDARKEQAPVEPGAAGASAAEATMEMLRKRAPSQAQINPQALTQLFTLPERLQRPTKRTPVVQSRQSSVAAAQPVASSAMASSIDEIEGTIRHDVGSEPAYAWEGEDEYAPYWEPDGGD